MQLAKYLVFIAKPPANSLKWENRKKNKLEGGGGGGGGHIQMFINTFNCAHEFSGSSDHVTPQVADTWHNNFIIMSVCAKNYSAHWPFGPVASIDLLAQTKFYWPK